jgi:hypothetical protein
MMKWEDIAMRFHQVNVTQVQPPIYGNDYGAGQMALLLHESITELKKKEIECLRLKAALERIAGRGPQDEPGDYSGFAAQMLKGLYGE